MLGPNSQTRRRFLASASCLGAAFALRNYVALPTLADDLGQDPVREVLHGYEVFHSYTARSKLAKLVKSSPSSVWGLATDTNLKYAWQQAVLDAFLEMRPRFLPGKINTAERAIDARLSDPQQLQLDERLALSDGLQSLQSLHSLHRIFPPRAVDSMAKMTASNPLEADIRLRR